MSPLTFATAGRGLPCGQVMIQETAMNPARGSSYGDRDRLREPVDPRSVTTAVQITVAWLIAFACVAFVTLCS